MRCSPPDGIALIDKAAGSTSHDVVARMRRLCGTRRIGHAGTLDPMATGLLVLGVGRATRLLTHLVGLPKAYAATIRLGQATVSDDADGALSAAVGVGDPDRLAGALPEALAQLRGDILQVPARVSAIKVAGERAYARVRAGEDVQLAARPVTVTRFDVVGQRAGRADDGTPVLDLDVLVECSSGTYVRALARDLGDALGVGGHLTALRRTAVGPFRIEEARTLDQLENAVDGVPLTSMTAAALRCFPAALLDESSTAAVRHGAPVPALPAPGLHAALAPDGHLVALVENRGATARARLVVDPA